MPTILSTIRVNSLLGLIILLLVWLVLFNVAHLFVFLLRRERLIGWAIGPLGLTFVALHEPSTLIIWLDVLVPALVSICVLYVGLFTTLSPVMFPHHPLFEVLLLLASVLITSTGDLMRALRDLCYPLGGEIGILQNIHLLRATAARIHFTPFGQSYLVDRFGSPPSELLKVL